MGKLLAGIAIVGGLLNAPLHAQPPRGPRPWWDGDVSKNANLSETQQKQVAQTRDSFRPRMRETRQAVMKANADVAASFNEDPVDQAKAMAAIERLAAANAEVTRTVSQLELKLRAILTAQQWQAMNERQGSWPGRGGRGRRGPPPTSTSTSTTTSQQK
jgi:Spy/CpxP family protein refolding chaperone